MLISSGLESLAKQKERNLVRNRRDFGRRNDEEAQLETAYRMLVQGNFLDEESAWAAGINRLSEKIGRLRHGAYKINGKCGEPLRIVQWAPEESKERCIYALFANAPFSVQQKWNWINTLSNAQLVLYDFNNKEYLSSDIPGQMTFADFDFFAEEKEKAANESNGQIQMLQENLLLAL